MSVPARMASSIISDRPPDLRRSVGDVGCWADDALVEGQMVDLVDVPAIVPTLIA